jgi:3-hydroxyacyl-[acyl-carrier-protein] dehydratase
MPDQTDPPVELYDLLPHRPPILLVDRITDWSPGDWIETVTTIDGNEACYADLTRSPSAVPYAYAYPSVLVLESFVQSAAVLWARTARAEGRPHQGTLVLAGVKDADFHRSAFPGDALRHRVRLTGRVGSNAFLAGETTLARTGEIVLTVGAAAVAIRPGNILERVGGPSGPHPLGPRGMA